MGALTAKKFVRMAVKACQARILRTRETRAVLRKCRSTLSGGCRSRHSSRRPNTTARSTARTISCGNCVNESRGWAAERGTGGQVSATHSIKTCPVDFEYTGCPISCIGTCAPQVRPLSSERRDQHVIGAFLSAGLQQPINRSERWVSSNVGTHHDWHSAPLASLLPRSMTELVTFARCIAAWDNAKGSPNAVSKLIIAGCARCGWTGNCTQGGVAGWTPAWLLATSRILLVLPY